MNYTFLTLASATLLASFTLGACKSDTADDTDDAGTTDAARAACEDTYGALKSFYDRCYPGSTSSDAKALRDYQDRAIDACAVDLSLPGTSSSLLDAYKTCGTALKSADCKADTDDLCAALGDAKGERKAGESCESATQCDSGACAFPSRSSTGADAGTTASGANEHCGQCAKVVAIGADCNSDDVTCGDAAYCDYDSSGSGDDTGTCKAEDKAGDACENYCTGDNLTCMDGTCKSLPAKGEACNGDCASGLRCVEEVCAEPLAEGATCDPDQDGCGSGLDCNSDTSKCAKPPAATAKIGEACGVSDTGARCAEGFCYGVGYDTETQELTDGTCRAYAKPGESCTDGSSTQQDEQVYCEPYLDCLAGKCEEPGRRCSY